MDVSLFARPDFKRVSELLVANQLPVADLSALNPDNFLGIGDPQFPSGVIGLENFSPDGLLRSLVVDKRARGTGCGKCLVQGLESLAKERGINTLYLLTETAEMFFKDMGYVATDRQLAPTSIRHSQEFSTLCPDDAVLMNKAM